MSSQKYVSLMYAVPLAILLFAELVAGMSNSEPNEKTQPTAVDTCEGVLLGSIGQAYIHPLVPVEATELETNGPSRGVYIGGDLLKTEFRQMSSASVLPLTSLDGFYLLPNPDSHSLILQVGQSI